MPNRYPYLSPILFHHFVSYLATCPDLYPYPYSIPSHHPVLSLIHHDHHRVPRDPLDLGVHNS